jgi:hypothetical protein
VLPEAAALKSTEQELPPLDAVQEASALARVFSLSVATVSVEGTPFPGELPVLALTRLPAVTKALSRPAVLVQVAPTLPPLDRKGASAQAEATVVASLTAKELPALMLSQGPSAAISQSEELLVPLPTLPPLDNK